MTGTASIPFPAIGDGLGLAAYHWRKSATWSESSPAVHPRAMSYGPKCDALPVVWDTRVLRALRLSPDPQVRADCEGDPQEDCGATSNHRSVVGLKIRTGIDRQVCGGL